MTKVSTPIFYDTILAVEKVLETDQINTSRPLIEVDKDVAKEQKIQAKLKRKLSSREKVEYQSRRRKPNYEKQIVDHDAFEEFKDSSDEDTLGDEEKLNHKNHAGEQLKYKPNARFL